MARRHIVENPEVTRGPVKMPAMGSVLERILCTMPSTWGRSKNPELRDKSLGSRWYHGKRSLDLGEGLKAGLQPSRVTVATRQV